jgi:hypothetical protein
MTKVFIFLAFLFLSPTGFYSENGAAAPPVRPPKITSTESLIKAMQQRYAGKWAKTITFTQYNTHYAADTVQKQSVWYEALEYPRNFRIDFGEPKEGNAVIFSQDSVYNFQAGQLKNKRAQPNNLTLLAGGIYFVSAEEALKRLKEAKYDTSLFHEESWAGRPVYVVGAMKGDSVSEQFWIDKAHLYLVRTINRTAENRIQEARFGKQVRVAGGWSETEVLFLSDGQRRQLEEYKNIQSNPVLPPAVFNASQFGKVHWLK